MKLRLPSADEYEDQIVFSASAIDKRLEALGEAISKEYPNGLILLANQRSAAVFLADLLRKITVPVDFDIIEIGSVSVGSESPQLFIRQAATVNIQSEDVLLVTDIVRSAFSAHFLLEQLHAKLPKSLEICTLLYNPEQQLLPIPVKYFAFQNTYHSVCGYGMSYHGKGRNYPDIIKLIAEK